MTIRQIATWFLLLAMAFLLSACLPCTDESMDEPEVPVEPEPPVVIPSEPEEPKEPVVPQPPTKSGYFETTQDEEGNPIIEVLGEDGRPVSHVFNFEFDEADLASGDFSALSRHAEALVANRDRSAIIEGHCDERGTREYNLALGERRAQAVADFLMSAGVRSSQLTVVSFGEEVPIDAGNNEAAWSKNRRAVIKIK